MIINLGDAPFKAFIKVTYPNGSCTVSLGNKSFTHSGGGTHTFTVNKKGTWTVTCTSNDGYNTKATSTVNLTYVGQVTSVTLSYTLWLYNKGDFCSAVTGGWTNYSSNSGGVLAANASGSGGVWARTAKAIKLTNYKTLNMHIVQAQAGDANTHPYIGIGETYYDGNQASLDVQGAVNATKSLNISSLTSGKVFFGASGFTNGYGASYAGHCRINQCWLSM